MPGDIMVSSVLLVTAHNRTTELFQSVLTRRQFNSPTVVQSAGHARRIMVNSPVDIVVIDSPLADESGMQLAVDFAGRDITGVLLLVSSEQYEQVQYEVGQKGIITISKPLDMQLCRQAMSLLQVTEIRLKKLKQRTESLEMKMAEIRMINRAKLILVESLRMSEADAHRYIEKTAMDRCVKRREIAEQIIKNAKNIQK